MTVYIVIKHSYDHLENYILAVVDSKEKAEEIANSYRNCEIQEWEVE